MVASYTIAANNVIDETTVSRSRFICYLIPCCSKSAAKAHLKTIQALHPQASHHCYAFIAGRCDDSQQYGFSDDGEPSGTAGRPMLAVLQGSNIGEISAVVVRYFGGTKLGTGGLQRAYGGSVRQALALLQTETKILMEEKRLACQYTQIKDIEYIVKSAGGFVVDQQFSDQVCLQLSLPLSSISQVTEQLRTMSSGTLMLENIESN